ncbi:MAG: DEAD/DEAH box helicase family protein [Sulfuricurvum sp.]|nr:DEAD/DEAH box helicase family protein [Sulfuricurvum sp.]
MATKTLKRYQEKAVEKLTNYAKELLDSKKAKKTIVFQSPTGSGKTFMMSAFIEELISEREDLDLCFLWISIGSGKLHEQSYRSLKREFGYFPVVHLLEEEFFGHKEAIEKNEVVVVNWDKLNQKDAKTGEWKNSLMRDSETWNFREVLANTREQGKIILIIDESHTNSTGERALELRDKIIKADLTIEMSATPVISENEYDERVKVNAEDVIEEGMIKKEIIINDGLLKFDDDEVSSEEMILKAAYSKRLELANLYKASELNVNPMVLIQLPSGDKGEAKLESVQAFLAGFNITTDNGKLAIWLSEEKINLELLHRNDNEVEYLIFKQAIGTGWDCPRAQILVRFREVKSLTFNIQTVGRILRMPEGQHYENDVLNKAYVYVNTVTFDIAKEVSNPNIIKSLLSTRKEIYGELKLRSYYRNRIDYGDITSSIEDVLIGTFNNYFGLSDYEILDTNKKIISQKIDMDVEGVTDDIMFDTKIKAEIFDYLDHHSVTADNILRARYDEGDIDYLFDDVIRENLNGYAPKRSMGIVENAIYAWFKYYLNMSIFEGDNQIKIMTIVLRNRRVFAELIDQTIKAYKPTKEEEIAKKIQEIEVWNDVWEIAAERRYNPNTHTKYDYALSLYEPCYLSFDSQVEHDFIDYLEKQKILWWWQNGSEHMALNFGIKYGVDKTFQPDFIVAFSDGRIGLFDTKAAGYQEKDNSLKSDALQNYIDEENRKGKNIFGGLVIKDGEHFRIYTSIGYNSFLKNPDKWDYFSKIIE